jgi:hypothetical protein
MHEKVVAQEEEEEDAAAVAEEARRERSRLTVHNRKYQHRISVQFYHE